MPELPEVETVRRVLEPQLAGRLIEEAEARRTDIIAHPDAASFQARLQGQRFSSMSRRGKFLTAHLESGDRLIIHLRMTGCLLIAPEGLPEEKHTHIVLHLDGKQELRFSDTRRFGRMWLIANGEEDRFSGIGSLGLEPDDSDLTARYLASQFSISRRAIKECLMDQTVIAGIGNIYSDEILFSSSIMPNRPALSLTPQEWERLSVQIPQTISSFIEWNTISAEDYLRTKGKEYRNTPHIRIYGHRGEPCPICSRTLEHATIGGRGSTFCPGCQR